MASKSIFTREAVALALARGETISEAAAGARVAVRTVAYWRQQEDFRQRVEALRAEILERTMGQMIDTTTAAAVRLRRLVRSKNERIALRACNIVLSQAARLRESVSLEQRIRQLEEAEAARNTRKIS
jgi:hypothetical protein